MIHVGNGTFGFNLSDDKSKLFYAYRKLNNSTESAQ